MTTEYPELEKLRAVREKSQDIGEFIEWLFNEKKYLIARYRMRDEEFQYEDDELIYVHFDIEKMLAEYFGVDLDKCEKERRIILDRLKELR